MWPVSASPFDNSNPEKKPEVPVSSPHEVPVHLFSLCTARGEAQDSHGVQLRPVEVSSTGSDIIRRCVCSKQKWILLIAWALRLWDQNCDQETMKDQGGILAGFSYSPLLPFEEDSCSDRELPGLGSHFFVLVCTAPSTRVPLLLAQESSGFLYYALAMLGKETIHVTKNNKKNLPQCPFPYERFFVGFLIHSRLVTMILSYVKGDLNFPALRFFSIFVQVNFPHT